MNIYKGYKGKVPIPPSSGDYALLSDNGTIKWGVAGGGGTGTFTDYEDKIFVAKHGNNSNDGLNIESAVLTISQAVSLANSLISGGSSKVAIKVADGGRILRVILF